MRYDRLLPIPERDSDLSGSPGLTRFEVTLIVVVFAIAIGAVAISMFFPQTFLAG
jgi:hypothetical protein